MRLKQYQVLAALPMLVWDPRKPYFSILLTDWALSRAALAGSAGAQAPAARMLSRFDCAERRGVEL